MARSRKRQKSKAQKARTRSWQKFLHWAKDNPEKALGMVATFFGGLSTLVYGLGLFALRSREGLLGLPEPSLDYPHQESVLTGLNVVWRLLFDAVASLVTTPFTGNLWLRAGIVASLACLALLVVIGRRPLHGFKRWPPFALVVLALLFGLRFQIAALYPSHEQDAKVYPSYELDLHGGPAAEVTFESISWLTNETDANTRHRQTLNGLVFWFLAVALAGLWSAWRQRNLTPWRRYLLLGLFVLLVALALRPVPRSYAYAHWGISYPTLAVAPECEAKAALSAAAQEGQCCIYDVSAKGTPTTTVQRGTCPDSVSPTLRWKEDDALCLSPKGRSKVIDDDC